MARKPIAKPEATKPHNPVTNPNRVWIELELPKGDTEAKRKAAGDTISALANNLLQRITPGTSYRFFWSADKAMYCYGQEGGSYRYLRDNGEWLNLDFVGRPIADWSNPN